MHAIARYCTLLHPIAPYCTLLHAIAPYCTLGFRDENLIAIGPGQRPISADGRAPKINSARDRILRVLRCLVVKSLAHPLFNKAVELGRQVIGEASLPRRSCSEMQMLPEFLWSQAHVDVKGAEVAIARADFVEPHFVNNIFQRVSLVGH